MLVLTRRAFGALAEPLSAGGLVMLGVVLALAAVAFRLFVDIGMQGRRPIVRYTVWAMPSLVLFVWIAGTLLPATPVTGVIGFVGLLVAEELWSWRRMLGGEVPAGTTAPAGTTMPAGPAAPPRPALASEPVGLASTPASVDLLGQPPEVATDAALQSMVRRREESGAEVIEGFVRAELSPGERHATAHVAICPPFASVPVCYAEPCDGPPAQVKVGQVLPYGARFEIKLDEPAEEPTAVVVEFSIQERAE